MLQAQGLKLNTGSYSRTQASLVAYELFDRMRTIPAALDSFVDLSTTSTSCDPSSGTIEDQIYCWKESAKDVLGPSAGFVLSTVGAEYVLTINWEDQPLRDRDKDSSTVQGAIQRSMTMRTTFNTDLTF